MIFCNLAVILAQKQTKITEVSRNTNISRTTLTSLSKGDSKGVQFDTINTLCRYLEITPTDFFEYSPIDFSFNFSLPDPKDHDLENDDSSAIKDITGSVTCDLNGQSEKIELSGLIREHSSSFYIEISLKNKLEQEKFNYYKNQLSQTLQAELNRQCENSLNDLINNEINDLVADSENFAGSFELKLNI